VDGLFGEMGGDEEGYGGGYGSDEGRIVCR
jgi:hypothetical protein